LYILFYGDYTENIIASHTHTHTHINRLKKVNLAAATVKMDELMTAFSSLCVCVCVCVCVMQCKLVARDPGLGKIKTDR